MSDWHHLPPQAVLDSVASNAQGLSHDEAAQRLAQHGPNRLPPSNRLGVVVINAIIGFIQECKAEKAMDAIRLMLSPEATVLREGKREVIAAEALVPGDIVLLQSGDKVPADLRLLSVKKLRSVSPCVSEQTPDAFTLANRTVNDLLASGTPAIPWERGHPARNK